MRHSAMLWPVKLAPGALEDRELRALVAGPIVRASEFLPQLRKPRDPNRVAVSAGLALIGLGLIKKVAIAERILAASQATRDPLWRLPLWRNYRRLYDSDVADINNSGRGGFAGSIVGALFLDHFVPEDVAWAHLDVYAWNDAGRPGRPVGGEAQGLRAILEALS